MQEYRPFLIGLSAGYGLGVVTFFLQPTLVMQRIGVGVVVIGALALLVWVLAYVLEAALKTFKLYRLFLQFVVERAREHRR